jgi:hypothetical protein
MFAASVAFVTAEGADVVVAFFFGAGFVAPGGVVDAVAPVAAVTPLGPLAPLEPLAPLAPVGPEKLAAAAPAPDDPLPLPTDAEPDGFASVAASFACAA